MTDHPCVEDANGRALHVGDVVEIVHGGEKHRLHIKAITPHPEGGAATVEGDITVTVHAAGTHRVTEGHTPEGHMPDEHTSGAGEPAAPAASVTPAAPVAPHHTSHPRTGTPHGGRTR